MKQVINLSKKGYSFMLVPVEESFYHHFNSFTEKSTFIDCHTVGTYFLSVGGSSALEYRYFVIDTSASGFVLNPRSASSFNECMSIIEQYM